MHTAALHCEPGGGFSGGGGGDGECACRWETLIKDSPTVRQVQPRT